MYSIFNSSLGHNDVTSHISSTPVRVYTAHALHKWHVHAHQLRGLHQLPLLWGHGRRPDRPALQRAKHAPANQGELWTLNRITVTSYRFIQIGTCEKYCTLNLIGIFWGQCSSILCVCCAPIDQPDLASYLPALLGLPAYLLTVLRACGLWHWPGYYAHRRPCLLPGRVLGQQATVLQHLCWYVGHLNFFIHSESL